MRQTKTASRLLALALTVLMLASCLVALPAAAAETASGATVLWGYDFASFGKVDNAAMKAGYFTENDVFNMDVSGTGATALNGGLLAIGGATYILGADTTGEKPNNDFFSLMNGQYPGYTSVGSTVFYEFDFQRMYKGGTSSTSTYGRVQPLSDGSCSWSYIDAEGNTITSADVANATLYIDHGGSGDHSLMFITHSNGQKVAMFFRMAENGMIYTSDNYGTAADALSYGGVYYKDANGNKVYLPATASVSDLNLDGCIKDPAKAYQMTYVDGKEYTPWYRVGVSLKVAAVSSGNVTMEATVYIRTTTESAWESVGTSTYQYVPVGSTSSATTARDKIQLTGNTGSVRMGGKWSITACNGDYHVCPTKTASVIDPTLFTCECLVCGSSWVEKNIDGVAYKGVEVEETCEKGAYTVWLPKEGIGSPFVDSEYSAPPKGHSYSSSNGKCSVCGEYEFLSGFNTGASGFRVETGSAEADKPRYNAEDGYWSWPDGGYMTIREGMLDGTAMKPYIYSFDIKVDGAVLKNEGKSALWQLMTWQNNGDAGNYQKPYLYLGATGETENDSLYLALGDDSNGTKLLDNAVFVFERGEWYNIAVAVNPAVPCYSVYVDGEYVGAVQSTTYTPNMTYTSTIVRMGMNTVSSKHYFQYNLKNINLERFDTAEGLYNAAPNNELFRLEYDRYQYNSAMSTKSTHFLGTFISFAASNNTKYKMADGTVFAMLETPKQYKQISLYSNKTNNQFKLSDKRYEIKVTFAVPDTAELPSNGQNLVRLSKFVDTVKSENVKYSNEGQYKAYVAGIGDCLLYEKDGVTPLTFIRTFTDNVPESMSELRVIFDEGNNTYSVYVDNDVAYYLDRNGNPQPTLNLTMKVSSGAITGKTYGEITREDVVNAGLSISTDGMYDCHYVRLFREMPVVALQSVVITQIPDSDVEMIGVQEQRDENSFDLRFVAGIDDIYVNAIDFEVKAYYNGVYQGVQHVSTTSVYSSLNEAGGALHAYECSEGAYLAAFKVTGMERTGASNRYKFVVTPTTTRSDNTTVTGKAFTVVYDGEGRYLGNDRPHEADLSQYESLSTKPVMLELQAKSGEGDYEDFYVYTQCSDFSGRYYVRYRMTYYYDTRTTNGTNSATNLDSFRITAAELVKINGVSDTGVAFTSLGSLLSSGEISLAIKEYVYDDAKGGNGVSDFCGGFHGDEHIVTVDGVKQVSLKADDVSYVPGAETKLVQCDKITFDQTTKIDRWGVPAGENGQIVEHVQNFTFTDDGMKIDRKVTWLVDNFVVDSAYPMMFTLLRHNDGDAICEIVETFDANGKSLGRAELALHNTNKQETILSNAGTRKVQFSSATSGISAVASFTLGSGNQGVLSAPYIAYRLDGSGTDNKLYVGMKGSNSVSVQKNSAGDKTTKSQPSLGEVWEISTFYNIDYVKPNN